MREFYTYLHCKPNGDPFYVGKGFAGRAFKFSVRTTHHKNIVAKYGADNIGVFVFPCESEEQAFSDEVQHIAQLRREGFSLVNMTAGGEGSTGYKASEETKRKLSLVHRGNKYNLGRKRSEEAKAKTSRSLLKSWANKDRKPISAPKLRKCIKCGKMFDKRDCPECQKARNTIYYCVNKESIKVKNKEWYSKNKNTHQETRLKYYMDNKEKIIAQSKKWAIENKEKALESARKYQTKKRLTTQPLKDK